MMAHTTCHAYFANLHVVPKELHGVRVLRGIELNIMDFDGTVDMDEKILSRLDIAIASLHTPCLAPGTKEENTRACLKVMENPLVDILGHPEILVIRWIMSCWWKKPKKQAQFWKSITHLSFPVVFGMAARKT